MMKKLKLHRSVRLGFTGFSMGLADLVPGVSGGTIAFLFGIYDELLFSIKELTGQVPKLLIRGKFKQAFAAIPFAFIIPVISGMAIAIFGMVRIVTYLLDNHAVLVWSLFFGLVLGSAYIITKRVRTWTSRRILLLVSGAIATYALVGLPVLNIAASPLVMLVTGAIAICAMILPGISGSLLLVILGQYKSVIEAVSKRELELLFFFALGAAAGLALFSRILSSLLHNHHNATLAVLIGIMLGSLRKVWPWQLEQADKTTLNIFPDLNMAVVLAVMVGLLGFILVQQLEKRGIAKEHIDIDDKTFKKEIRTQHD